MTDTVDTRPTRGELAAEALELLDAGAPTEPIVDWALSGLDDSFAASVARTREEDEPLEAWLRRIIAAGAHGRGSTPSSMLAAHFFAQTASRTDAPAPEALAMTRRPETLLTAMLRLSSMSRWDPFAHPDLAADLARLEQNDPSPEFRSALDDYREQRRIVEHIDRTGYDPSRGTWR